MSLTLCTRAAAPAEPANKSMPIKHTRPKVQRFDNGFIIEETAMGPAEGKVRSSAALHAHLWRTLMACQLASSCCCRDVCGGGAVRVCCGRG